ncbi:MAG: hypothetical protein PHN33_02690 [Candidatus Peribacteraceae bacterium]|nr:hypothetical protein [Candidatus Peribacteraceae bacterium]
MGNITQFWKELKEQKIDKGDYNFALFVFPLFPLDNPFSYTNAERLKVEVRFTGARFLSNATFSSMWLENAAFFNGVIFLDHATFSHVEFLKYADFSDTQFLGGATFACIFYEEANFRHCSFSSSHPTSFNPYFPSKEYTMFRGKTSFCEINFPRTFTFRHVDLSHVSFSGSNLEELTFLGCSFCKRKGRNELFDERKVFSSSGGLLPPAYFEVLEDMYRQLKYNFENRRDWRNASEFFVSQMEIRRLRLKIEANDLKIYKELWSEAKAIPPPTRTFFAKLHNSIPKLYTLKWWNRALERFFLAGFDVISRYGEQPDRALFWIVTLLLMGTIGIFASQPFADWNDAFLTTVRAVTFQQENNFDSIHRSTQWIITLLRIGSVIVLPLFFLALRRRFKR